MSRSTLLQAQNSPWLRADKLVASRIMGWEFPWSFAHAAACKMLSLNGLKRFGGHLSYRLPPWHVTCCYHTELDHRTNQTHKDLFHPGSYSMRQPRPEPEGLKDLKGVPGLSNEAQLRYAKCGRGFPRVTRGTHLAFSTFTDSKP